MKAARRTTRLGWSTASALLALFACAPEAVVVAELPAGADAGDAAIDAPCGETADCPAGTFCDKPSCDAVAGSCRPQSVFCDDTRSTVCGCDGVTYWNDCLRKRGGVSVSDHAECTGGAGCDTRTPCANQEASCAKLLAPPRACAPEDAGAPSPRGACWVLPATCPTDSADPPSWGACDAPNGACMDTCTAIRSETPTLRESRCKAP